MHFILFVSKERVFVFEAIQYMSGYQTYWTMVKKIIYDINK